MPASSIVFMPVRIYLSVGAVTHQSANRPRALGNAPLRSGRISGSTGIGAIDRRRFMSNPSSSNFCSPSSRHRQVHVRRNIVFVYPALRASLWGLQSVVLNLLPRLRPPGKKAVVRQDKSSASSFAVLVSLQSDLQPPSCPSHRYLPCHAGVFRLTAFAEMMLGQRECRKSETYKPARNVERY